MTETPHTLASGDEETGPLDQVLFLARAESRVHIVEHLSESGAATQRELRASLDASRTTVARSLRSLQDRGWIERDDGAYRLTPVGAIVADEFLGLLGTIQRTEELSAFLRWFPTDEFAPDFLSVEDAAVTPSTDGNPYAPARRQAEILHTADRLRILLPSIDLGATRTVVEQVIECGLEVETVVAPQLGSTIASEEFAPHLREMIETDRSEIFVAQTDLPFYLGLAGDGCVQVGVEDDEGFPRALLETTDDGVREWAEGVYEEYRAGAQRVSVEEL